jgi:GH25 family lysozyme M1 (1,4-beta-N-acetylmuramidase)
MRPIGVDISKWQAHSDLSKPHGVDFVKLHDKSDFIILRAGYAGSSGGAWTDERVHDYMKDLDPILIENPKPMTFYWYFRDDVSIMEQVERFAAVVNMYLEVVNLSLIVDAEVFVKSDLVSTQKIKDFQLEVENATGLKVDILYGRAGQLNEETTPGLPEVLPYLWIARYDADLDEQVDEPWEEGGPQEYVEPRDYDEWDFWQFASSGHGAEYGVVSASIDQNVYNGTLEELRSRAKLDQPDVDPGVDITMGKATAEQADVVVHGSMEVSFINAKTMVPAFITVQAAKGDIKKATIKLVVNGVRVLLRRRSMAYSDWFIYAFPRELSIKTGDTILVTLEGEGAASVKMVYEVWY